MPPSLRRNLAVAAMLIGASLLAGCHTPQLEGVVVEGAHPRIEFVNRGDARLNDHVVPEARVNLSLDPSSLNPQTLAECVTGPNGEFSVDIEAFGAGVLKYELGVLCQREGFKTLYQTMPMPKRNRVMMIVLTPGRDRSGPSRDFLQETERMGQDLLRR